MARAHVIAYETILDDEINQIIGVTHLGDASNCGTEFVALWPVTDFITLLRWGEVNIFFVTAKTVPSMNKKSYLQFTV